MNKLEWLEENIWWPIEGFWEDITDIPRRIKWFIQRGKRGYADCDVWDLDGYLTNWLPQAIRRLRNISTGYPANFKSSRQWNKILTEMANKIEKNNRILAWGWKDFEEYKKLKKEVDEGLKLFKKYFWNLWD